MYKDKDKQKEYNKERMRKARVAQQGNTKEGSTEQGSTLMTGKVATYPPIILALADPVKREKLKRITESLKAHNKLEGVTYGIGGPDFRMVDAMLLALHN